MKFKFIKSAGSCLAIGGMMLAGTVANADDTLRIVSWGGAYQKGQSLGIFQPAAKAMGITVKEDTYGGISDVKLMVKSGADKFDIFSSGAGGCASGGAEGILEKLDYSVIISVYISEAIVRHLEYHSVLRVI
jgi:putative spermidine/putrescine transport system substrate-binding protein